MDKVDPRYLAGINVVDAGVKGANGGETRVVIFEGHKFFPSVAEAKAWMASAEHLQGGKDDGIDPLPIIFHPSVTGNRGNSMTQCGTFAAPELSGLRLSPLG